VADAALLADATAPSYAPFTALAPPAAGKGFQMKIEPFSVKGNFERELFVYKNVAGGSGNSAVNAAPIFINKIEMKMRSNSHHFLLYTFRASTSIYPPKDTVRDIRNDDGTYNIINMLPMGNHVYFAGTQTPNSIVTFPPGFALELPANAALDLNAHYVNKTGAPLTGEAYANLHTIDASQVTTKVRTLDLGNTSLPLPAGQRTTHSKTFLFDQTVRIFTLTSHMHKLGERFIIKIKGGPRDGETVYDNTDWEHPKIANFDTPITLQAGQGLTSIITYNNTTTKQVNFGLSSEDEMGIIFGYYY
jgi:Copper type II ascorbate-dependent monooxygenase, C-terminal domain